MRTKIYSTTPQPPAPYIPEAGELFVTRYSMEHHPSRVLLCIKPSAGRAVYPNTDRGCVYAVDLNDGAVYWADPKDTEFYPLEIVSFQPVIQRLTFQRKA